MSTPTPPPVAEIEARIDELSEFNRQLFSDDEEVVYEMIQDYIKERIAELRAALRGEGEKK